MGAGCSSSVAVAISPVEVTDTSSTDSKQVVESRFHEAIIANEESKLRALIQQEGSKLITPFPRNRCDRTDSLETSIQRVLISAFEKVMDLERTHDSRDDISSSYYKSTRSNCCSSAHKAAPGNHVEELKRVADPKTIDDESRDVNQREGEPKPKPAPEPKQKVELPETVEDLGKKSTPKFDMHHVARVGDVHKLLMYCISDPKGCRDQFWERDDFDNIPLYYTCLNGHGICCAWLLIAMRSDMTEFNAKLLPFEFDRFIINALNKDIKLLLENKLDCEEYIRRCDTVVDSKELTQTKTIGNDSKVSSGNGACGEIAGPNNQREVQEEEDDDDYGDAIARLFD